MDTNSIIIFKPTCSPFINSFFIKKLPVCHQASDADLIGIPKRLIISQKTGKMIEYKERGNKKTKLIKIKDLMKFFNINF